MSIDSPAPRSFRPPRPRSKLRRFASALGSPNFVFSKSIGKCHRKPTAFPGNRLHTNTHRQLLSHCTLPWYSVGTSSDNIAAFAPSLEMTCNDYLWRDRHPYVSSSRPPNFIHISPLFFFIRKCRGAYTINFTSFFVTQQRCAVRCMSHELFSLCSLTGRKYFMIGQSNGSDDQSLDVSHESNVSQERSG